jgi:hypothetical protein
MLLRREKGIQRRGVVSALIQARHYVSGYRLECGARASHFSRRIVTGREESIKDYELEVLTQRALRKLAQDIFY